MEEVLIYIVGLLVIWIGWLITYYSLFHCLTLQLFGMTEKNNTVELIYNDIKFMWHLACSIIYSVVRLSLVRKAIIYNGTHYSVSVMILWQSLTRIHCQQHISNVETCSALLRNITECRTLLPSATHCICNLLYQPFIHLIHCCVITIIEKF